jgi:hypothetical protein
MKKTDKSTVFEIVFYVVLFFVLLGTGVLTIGGMVSFVGVALAFLGALFLLKMWKGW